MISVILPNRNEARVHELIDAIEQQGLHDIEIITAVDRYSKGKGWALRQGLKYAQGDVICFLDADLDIEPRMIFRLIPFLMDYDIVVARKPLVGHWSRKILSFLSRLYIRILFNINVDTQTGLKLFKRWAIPEWKAEGFAFDIEILSKAKTKNLSMIEVPIECTQSKKMTLTLLFNTLKDSLVIWYRLNILERK